MPSGVRQQPLRHLEFKIGGACTYAGEDPAGQDEDSSGKSPLSIRNVIVSHRLGSPATVQSSSTRRSQSKASSSSRKSSGAHEVIETPVSLVALPVEFGPVPGRIPEHRVGGQPNLVDFDAEVSGPPVDPCSAAPDRQWTERVERCPCQAENR